MSERNITVDRRIRLITDPDQPDLMIIDEIWKLNRYQILFPSRGIPPPILDIGAYKGYFSVMCASRGARVTAYEPNPESFEVLERNAAQNHLIEAESFPRGSIESHNAAVWKEAGKFHLHSHPTSHGCDTLINGDICRGNCGAPGSMVDCVSFDEIVGDSRWAFVKMDCEGAEYEILLNASDKSLSQIDQIAIELHGPKRLIEMYQHNMVKRMDRVFKLEALWDLEEGVQKYLYGVKG